MIGPLRARLETALRVLQIQPPVKYVNVTLSADDLAALLAALPVERPGEMSSETRETRDMYGQVLYCHGRPFSCYECGEEYAAELNSWKNDLTRRDTQADADRVPAASTDTKGSAHP